MIASQEKIGFQLLEKWESDDQSVGAIMQAGEVYSLIMFHGDCDEVDMIYLNNIDLSHLLKHVSSPASAACSKFLNDHCDEGLTINPSSSQRPEHPINGSYLSEQYEPTRGLGEVEQTPKNEVDQIKHGPLSMAYPWESPEYKMAYFAFNTLWEVMEEMTNELKQQMASSMGLSVEELMSVAEKLFTNNADPDNVKDDEITLPGE